MQDICTDAEALCAGYFLTKIFHPNVSKAGEICVNVLKRDWAPEMGLRHVLVIVRCLLIEPFPESALNEEAGKLLLEDYGDFAKHARLMTSIHAQHPKRCAAGVLQTITQYRASAAETWLWSSRAAPYVQAHACLPIHVRVFG